MHDLLFAIDDVTPCDRQTERRVLIEYVLAETVEDGTVKDIAETAGISRQAVYLRAKRLRSKLAQHSEYATALNAVCGQIDERLPPVLEADDFDDLLRAAIDAGLADHLRDPQCDEAARLAIIGRLGYSRCGDFRLSPLAEAARSRIAEDSTDDGRYVHISDGELAAMMPDGLPARHMETLASCAGLRRVSDYWIGRKATVADQAEAALLSIGRPATMRELCAEAGHPVSRMRNPVYVSPRISRSALDLWCLNEWGLEPYSGICDALTSRIEKAGGSVDLHETAADMASTFGVKYASVLAFAYTRLFNIKDGRVSLADTIPQPTLTPFADKASGFTDSGDPYWEFKPHPRHLKGYSIHIPAELAADLGCRIGEGAAYANVRSPEHVRARVRADLV